MHIFSISGNTKSKTNLYFERSYSLSIMSLIGIVANDIDFKNIRKAFRKKDISKSVSIIEINENNIENIRNISFETLFFCKNLDCTNIELSYLYKICENVSYLVINSDFNLCAPPSISDNCTVITFGLNQKATVTVSSISESGFVLSLQQNIIKPNKEVKEMEEKSIRVKNTNNFTLYKILVEYIIKIIYKT